MGHKRKAKKLIRKRNKRRRKDDRLQDIAYNILCELRSKQGRDSDTEVDTSADSEQSASTPRAGPSETSFDNRDLTSLFYESEASADGEKENVPPFSIPSEFLTLLGQSTEPAVTLHNELHVELVSRWENILKSGLDPQVANDLISKYPPAENCKVIGVPKLNPEIETAMTEQHKQRDKRLAETQGRLAAALAAIGRSLTILLTQEGSDLGLTLIEYLSDASRLLSDAHHQESEARRFLVASGLNKQCRETIAAAPIGEWLFGNDLTERMKAAKTLERSSTEFKPTKPKPIIKNFPKRQGNARGLPRTLNTSSRGRPKNYIPQLRDRYQQLPRKYYQNQSQHQNRR
ncbi:uncharacterized protein LOC116170229 [Photinus pyralis]|uniref:Uncharacterized protein n=1 Tax=Photinus pyralis TaxID=7054 RepID=A0A1Y1LG30_PHOPY|nr:uncharacterized protein LOC116159894 isoform X2 [Photinus pyralis]XP_031329092.1 uncharacterized protein LOC116160094 isoform X2 [Photinus pyralis]XP_031342331.1 uncharacterized protein LOC116170229 [Photinus pyralis]XP_031342338.1 uncharacterized protein LOC116170229 [Photinus pyralis]